MRYCTDHRPARMLRAVVLAPFDRLSDSPAWAKLVAVGGAALQYLLHAPFAHLMYLLVAMSVADYILGAHVARLAGEYDGNTARAGVLGKGAGWLQVLVVRALEAVIGNAGLPDTAGALSFGFAVLLLLAEIESFDGHKRQLTGRSTPFIGPVLDFLRGVAEGALPPRGKKGV